MISNEKNDTSSISEISKLKIDIASRILSGRISKYGIDRNASSIEYHVQTALFYADELLKQVGIK